jgi:phosphoribosyl 1,2-cyclic phosphodiesterase
LIVTLWGTRGSLPEAGPETTRYGGNTSCVEVRSESGRLLILDAGSGIRRLGKQLRGVRDVDILLTHLHMDHIQGLGFFDPLYEEGASVRIWGPPSAIQSLQERLGRYLSPPIFPVRIRELPASVQLHDSPRGEFQLGPFHVTADLVCHPGPTLGYRITENGAAVSYMPDHEPALGVPSFPDQPSWTSGYALAAGADLLIHDAQFSTAEYVDHVGWGHSSLADATRFAAHAGARRLVTFHHDPAHDDDALDAILPEAFEGAPDGLEIVAGIEGAQFEVAS